MFFGSEIGPIRNVAAPQRNSFAPGRCNCFFRFSSQTPKKRSSLSTTRSGDAPTKQPVADAIVCGTLPKRYSLASSCRWGADVSHSVEASALITPLFISDADRAVSYLDQRLFSGAKSRPKPCLLMLFVVEMGGRTK